MIRYLPLMLCLLSPSAFAQELVPPPQLEGSGGALKSLDNTQIKNQQLFLDDLGNIVKKEICGTQEVGELDIEIIDESSGLAISVEHQNRYYHVNDSGDGPYFYITNQKGEDTKRVEIAGMQPFDVEDLALSRCHDRKDKYCLFIADIGDNYKVRRSISIYVIEEEKLFDDVVEPDAVFELKYPDGAHNAEAFIVHPSGDAYIITKEYDEFSKKVSDPKIYRIAAKHISQSFLEHSIGAQDLGFGTRKRSQKTYPLQYITSLPLTTWQADRKDRWSKLVTAADINTDGTNLLLLTYNDAFEIPLGGNGFISPSIETMTIDAMRKTIKRLPQQEAIAYLPNRNDGSFIYTSEGRDSNRTKQAPMMRYGCENRFIKH